MNLDTCDLPDKTQKFTDFLSMLYTYCEAWHLLHSDAFHEGLSSHDLFFDYLTYIFGASTSKLIKNYFKKMDRNIGNYETDFNDQPEDIKEILISDCFNYYGDYILHWILSQDNDTLNIKQKARLMDSLDNNDMDISNNIPGLTVCYLIKLDKIIRAAHKSKYYVYKWNTFHEINHKVLRKRIQRQKRQQEAKKLEQQAKKRVHQKQLAKKHHQLVVQNKELQKMKMIKKHQEHKKYKNAPLWVKQTINFKNKLKGYFDEKV